VPSSRQEKGKEEGLLGREVFHLEQCFWNVMLFLAGERSEKRLRRGDAICGRLGVCRSQPRVWFGGQEIGWPPWYLRCRVCCGLP
jgi:hypothetical protein